MQTLMVQKGPYFKTHFVSMLILMQISWKMTGIKKEKKWDQHV